MNDSSKGMEDQEVGKSSPRKENVDVEVTKGDDEALRLT